MACEKLSKHCPIVQGTFLLDEDTSAIDFGPDWSIPVAGNVNLGPIVTQVILGMTWERWSQTTAKSGRILGLETIAYGLAVNSGLLSE